MKSPDRLSPLSEGASGPADLSDRVAIITGGARGADQLGYRWAWKHAIRHQLFRAEWARFGKSAGMRRNHQMAQAGDVLVACWDGQSPGTAHMIQCMEQLGKPVIVVRCAGA